MAKTWKKDDLMDVVGANLQVALEGLKLTQGKGFCSVILERNSRIGNELIEGTEMDLSYNGSMVHEICNLGLNFNRFKAQYIPRCCNTIAALAHLAKLVGTRLWMSQVPRCIRDFVTLDL